MNNNNLTEEQIILNDITQDVMDLMEYRRTHNILNIDYETAIASIYTTLMKAGYIKNDTTK